MRILHWAPLVLIGATAAPAASAADPPAAVLDTDSIWRLHVTHRPWQGEPRAAMELQSRRWVRWGECLAAPLPPADWAKIDFDDSGWPRRPGPIWNRYGGAKRVGMALVCLRGRFGVADPAAVDDLRLHLAYRGGARVRINGHEVARKHLPEGPIEPLTPAQAYPRTAFVTPGGEAQLRRQGDDEPREHRRRYESRLRELSVGIPKERLRKGTNVLAIELHRALAPEDLPGRRRLNWNTVGLVSVELTAANGRGLVPPARTPDRPQVWNAPAIQPVGTYLRGPDRFEPLAPIRLHAPRNGLCAGQVIVSSPEPLSGLSAEIGDLTSAQGARVPSGAFRVRYAGQPEGFVALRPEARRDAKVQPIWITGKLPADVPAGRYAGTLKIDGLDRPVTVPVQLRIFGWTVADPADWRTCVNLLQSPESVAGHYKTPMWSDRHFRLMAPSMRLMGRAGNDVLGMLAVAETVFGDDPLVLFRPQGDRYVPELKYLRRYLRMYDKHAGPPQFLSLHVWSYGMFKRGRGRDGGDRRWRAETIPVKVLRDGEPVTEEIPIYGAPGTEGLWREVMDGLRQCVEEMGWPRECILLGTSGDCWPSPTTVAFFRKIAPYARWRAITHGSGVPKWGLTPAERTQPNGMIVAYREIVRRITNVKVKPPGVPTNCNSRDCLGTDPFGYRSLAPTNVISANFNGFCWKGLDYWPYETAEGTRRSALNTYLHFGNIVGSTPRTLALPGEDGALATVQFEMLRQGIQDAEALQLIRDVVNDDALRAKLDPELARRSRQAAEDLLCLLETGLRYHPGGGGDLRLHSRRVHAAAAELVDALGPGIEPRERRAPGRQARSP